MRDAILSALPAGTSVPTALLVVLAAAAGLVLATAAGVTVARLVAIVGAQLSAHRAPTRRAPVIIRNAQED